MLNKKLVLSEEWNLQKVDLGDSVKYYLLNVKNGDVYKLNDTSYTFLSLFDGSLTCEEVVEQLIQIYDVDREELKKDFEEMISIWLKQKILEERG